MPGWKHAPGYGGRVKTLPYRENWVGVWNSWGCGSFDSLRSLRTTEEGNGLPHFAVILSGVPQVRSRRIRTPVRVGRCPVGNSRGCGSFDSLRSLRTTEERNGFPIFAVILSGGREPGVEESVPLCVVADARWGIRRDAGPSTRCARSGRQKKIGGTPDGD